jgi:acyl-CoA reductase-like NAD-dependent aldehyde dehydrogenase
MTYRLSFSFSRVLSIRNPATEEELATLALDSVESVAEKVSRAAKAQRSWARVPLAEKISIIEKAQNALADPQRQQILAETLTGEMGKPISQSFGRSYRSKSD